MARRTITGTANWSSQTTRDAALTRVTDALAGVVYSDFTSAISPGINTNGTTGITISIVIEDPTDAVTIANALYDAWVPNKNDRHNSGWLSVNKV